MTQQIETISQQTGAEPPALVSDLAAVEVVAEGARLFLALVDSDVRWFQRRAEFIDFSRDAIKRTILIDVLLPQHPPAALPVVLRAKSSPGPALVFDRLNRRVPLLTTEEGAEIVFTALVRAAEEEGVSPSPEEEDLLLTVVTDAVPSAERAKAQLQAQQPAWGKGKLRQLVDLIATSLPVFVAVADEDRRQVFELKFPTEGLTRHDRSRWLGMGAIFLRGEVTVGAEMSSWPPAESMQIEFAAPRLGEITSFQVEAEAREGFLEVRPHGSTTSISLDEPSAVKRPVVWLHMTLRRSVALGLSALALALSLLLCLIGLDVFPESANRVASVGLLVLPLALATRAFGQAVLDGGDVSAALIRAPIFLIAVASLLGLVGFELRDSAGLAVGLWLGMGIAAFTAGRLFLTSLRIRIYQRVILRTSPGVLVAGGPHS